MKVNKITTQPEFQPVTLQITIESQEELEAILEFSGKERGILIAAVSSGLIRKNQEGCVSSFLGSIYQELNK